MKLIGKKWLNLLTAAAVALGGTAVPFTALGAESLNVDKAEEKNEEIVVEKQARLLGFCDFDGNGSIVGGGSVKQEENDHKKVCEVSAAGAAGLNFDKKISSGKVIMSWDAKYPQNFSAQVFRTYTEKDRGGTAFENMVVNTDGYVYGAYDNRWNTQNRVREKYEKNVWYQYELIYDFDKRTITLYIDGHHLAVQDMIDSLTEIQSFAIMPTGAGPIIDNVGAVYIPTNGAMNPADYPFLCYCPDEYNNVVQPWIESGKYGNSYFGGDISYKVKLVNNQDVPVKGKVAAKFINCDGISTPQEKDYSLDAFGNVEMDFALTTEAYGESAIEVTVLDERGNTVGQNEEKVYNISKGKTNYKAGFNDHISRGYMGYGHYDMMKEAGIGSYRDGVDTAAISPDTKVVKSDKLMKFFDIIRHEDTVRPFVTLYLGGLYAGWDERIPLNDAERARWLEYVKVVLRETKDIKNIDFEIGNEYNYPMQWNPEKYTSELYYEVCKAVYPVIKEARPDARVFVLSTANNNETERFMDETLKLGIGNYCDGISLHPYDVFNSPESAEAKERIANQHALLEKYGLGDLPVIYSEYGWTASTSTGVGEKEKARYIAQGMVINQDRFETVEIYNLERKVTYGDFEDRFGYVKNYQDEIPYEPTPPFLSYATYNRFMTGTKNTQLIDFAGGVATVAVTDNDQGTKSLMAWSKKDNPDTDIAINVGTDKVTVADINGNTTEIKTENGILNMHVNQDPQYIIGDITSYEEVTPDRTLNETSISVVESDIAHITGKLPDNSYQVEVVCPDNIKADEPEIKPDGTFTVKLNAGSNSREKENLRVRFKKGDDIVYGGVVKIEYSNPAVVTSSIIYYRAGYWQLKLKVSNVKNGSPISGKVVLTEPTDMEISEKQGVFENIAVGGSRYLYLTIEPKYTKSKFDINGYVELDDGAKIDFSGTSYFVGLMHLAKAPTIDGKIQDGEYNTVAPVRLNTKDYVVKKLADYPGLEETSGEIYLNYDENNLYLAAKIYDSVEGATGDSNHVWQNDSIQLALAEVADYNAPRTEYCIGKDNKGVPTITRYAFMGTKTVAAGGEGDEVKLGDDIKLEIGRDGMYTIYEFKMPWAEVFGANRPVLDRRDLRFSALINDNDGLGRTGYVEFCPGIGAEKNPAYFSKLQAMN